MTHCSFMKVYLFWPGHKQERTLVKIGFVIFIPTFFVQNRQTESN